MKPSVFPTKEHESEWNRTEPQHLAWLERLTPVIGEDAAQVLILWMWDEGYIFADEGDL